MKLSHPIRLFILLVGAPLLTACSNPGYNDNPSQQMTKATVGCLVATDFYAVYFSAYIKPAEDGTKKTVEEKKALFRSYCKDIPTTGTAFFTADLVGKELRDIPIGIRVVEQELTGGDDTKAENFKDLRTLVEVPAKLYPKGAVEAQAQIDKIGYYAIYLMVGGEEALSEDDRIRIPLHVGVDPDAKPIWMRMGIIIGIILSFALFAFVAFRFMRRRNNI